MWHLGNLRMAKSMGLAIYMTNYKKTIQFKKPFKDNASNFMQIRLTTFEKPRLSASNDYLKTFLVNLMILIRKNIN